MGVAIGLDRRRACLLRRRHRGFAAAGHCTRSRPIFRPQQCLATACNREDCNGARCRTASVDGWRAEADRNEFGGIQCDRINIREPRLLEPKQPESELPQPGSAGPCAADAGANERCLDGTKHVPRPITKLAPSPTPDAADGTASAPDRERHFAAGVDVSTCFPSASAVRQEHPEAWPSWTLRTPGHEGTRCWYAAPRATARPSR